MTEAIGYLQDRLHSEMVRGQMHATLRDVGRLAGGLFAVGDLREQDVAELGSLAESLAINKGEAATKWAEAVAFGRGEPLNWDSVPRKPDRALDWGDEIGCRIVDPRWVEPVKVREPETWSPVAQVSEYLATLFSADEYVGYVTAAGEDGKPRAGNYSRTAGQLLEELARYREMGPVFGDVDPEVGAWIRFNPLDGKGACDKNVTRYRFALVESDDTPIEQQRAIYDQLELPIAALVHSGNKSLHAIVRIEADSLPEYSRRVKQVYGVCDKNGLAIDRQNQNPSRLSRMPGVERNGKRQFLVATNLGKKSWSEWAGWITEVAKAATRPAPVLTCFGDIQPRRIKWLWRGRIALGRITLLVGRPGEGKSFLTTDAAARVSTGTAWPDGALCQKGSVIFISAEDDPGDTIRPRLDAHRADVDRVHLLSAVRRGDSERMITLADVDAIEAALVKLPDCKLIVVDPIGSFLGGQTDAHRDNEVRSVLAPIARLAEKFGPAVLMVAHRRKGVGDSADDTALGSRAFTGIARAVWHLSRDSEDKRRRLLLPGKNNLSAEGSGLAFSIDGEPPRLWWDDDPVAMTADQGLAAEQAAHKPGPDAQAQDAAAAWLWQVLDEGPRLAKELVDEWKNGPGGSERTLKRARQFVGVESYRDTVPGPWYWRLPSKGANQEGQDPKEGEPGPLGPLAKNTGNLPLF